MSGSDLVPQDEPADDRGRIEGSSRKTVDKAPDPFRTDGMPLALLEFHSPSLALVNMPPTPTAKHIVWLISALFTMSLVAAGVFPMNRVVNAPGRLVSSDATLVIQPLETAIIRSIDVRVGEHVKKGQVVAHLDPTMSEADLTNMRLQRDSYQAEVDRLRAEADDQQYKVDTHNKASVDQAAAFSRRKAEYDAKVAQFNGEMASIKSQLEEAVADATMYKNRARIAGQVLAMRQQLQRQQVGSRLNTLGAQDELTEAERNEVGAQKTANSARARLQATEAEKKNYIESRKAEIYSDLNIAQHRLDEAASNYEKAKLRGSLIELKAPEDAVVLTVSRVSKGSVLSGGEQLMTMVPSGQGLEMEATLRGQDIGYVRVGDHALLKFATFPYDQFGGAEGTVASISADAFGNDQSENGAPRSPAEAMEQPTTPDGPSLNGYYRVRIRIDKYTLHGVPDFFHPIPGLPLSANIDVGKRTMLRYFFNRVIPAATNGMREPN